MQAAREEWLPKGSFLLDIVDVDDIFGELTLEADSKAKTSFDRQKWMMFGYWKAIAIHLRKARRTLRSELIKKAVSRGIS
jgi:hypothetical protein